MGVLAHLAGSMGEPGVTQALAYILNRHPDLVQAFVNLLDAAGITFEPRPRVESERGNDGERIPGRPDMKIHALSGQLRVLVENKFWADLTNSQPVDYLNMLSRAEDLNCGLLFIVPEQRVEKIWDTLKTRCNKEDFNLGQDSGGAPVRWVRVETNTMLVTNWQTVLRALCGAAKSEDTRCDLRQFGQLVETLEDLQAFPALRPEEVTNADLPRRIINYIELFEPICDKLTGSVRTIRPRAASFEDRTFHRDLTWDNRQGEEVGARLALSFDVWRRSGGITPLWLYIAPNFRPPEVFKDLRNLLEEEGMHVYEGTSYKYIAIRLLIGVERGNVIEDAVEQILRVIRKMT